MTKIEFINDLTNMLSGLDQTDIKTSVEFYSEMIDDSIEDGISEEEAVYALGDISGIAAQIRSNLSKQDSFSAEKEKDSYNKKRLPIWVIVLLVIGSPLWLGIIAVLISIYLSFWAVIAALYASDIAMLVGGFAGLVAFPFSDEGAAQALMILGTSLIFLGISILLFFGVNQIARLLFSGTKKIFLFGKSIFIGEG